MTDARTGNGDLTTLARTSSDPLLELLIEMTDETGAELPITLQVGGLVVSGKLVSKESYLELFTSLFTQGITDRETVEGLRTSFAGVEGAAGDEAARPSSAVHVKDAAIFGVGNMPVPYERGALWRGRLSEVDAFFLGEIVMS